MIHLFWNCRGLGSDTVVRALHGLIRKYRPSMIFLAETKMKDHRIIGVRRRLGFSNGFDVAPVGQAGGLSLWFDDSIQVEVRNFSKHYIDTTCCLVDSQQSFRFTGVYGTAYRSEKESFWRSMIHSFGPSTIPWICGGDFNEFLWEHEKVGGAEVRHNRQCYLEDFMNKTELIDLGFSGQKFTWRGHRNGQLVEVRLDRGLANASWQTTWPNSTVTNGTTLGSDHCPIIVRCKPREEMRRKLFRFEAFWSKDEECKGIIKNVWEGTREGNLLDRWNHKINLCRGKLSRWSKEKFKNRGRQIGDLMDHLGYLQLNWNANRFEIDETSKLIDQLRSQEEKFWQQRSRVQWLKEGDANTRFFHQSTLQRRRRNKVVALKDSEGGWVENPRQVRNVIDVHFRKLFTSDGSRDWGGLLDCVSSKVSREMNEALTLQVSEDEVKSAAMQMGG